MKERFFSRFNSASSRRVLLRLAITAAILIVLLLVSWQIFLFTRPHQTNTLTPRGTNMPIPVTISSLHMLDMQTGWALTDKGQLVRTTDGGLQWKNVSPPSPFTPNTTSVVWNVLDAAHAWIATPGGAPASTGSGALTTRIFRTSDGGQSWQNTTVQTSMVTQITFINPQIGWLLSRHQLSEAAETIQILRSSDGGQNWTQVSAVLPASTDLPAPGRLPFGGNKTGISFLNEQIGWITGSYAARGYPFLYRTSDGGKTWYPQALNISPSQTTTQLATTTPHFFSATSGILPLSATSGSTTTVTFYATHDSGNSWQPTTPITAQTNLSTFIDPHYGWISDKTHLYTTSTGGQQWTELATNPPLHRLSSLNFVTHTIGWAIGSTQPNSISRSLLKTTDGGHTWNILAPVII